MTKSLGLRRILVTVVFTLVIVFVGYEWIVPVALSYYGARKAPAVARIVPSDLKDFTISQAPGSHLSYFGYEFEIPWTDLDQTQTKFYPIDHPNRVVLNFRSGLRMIVTAMPARAWVDSLPGELKASPEALESTFGHEAMQSDYNFMKVLYEFTPATMHHWTISSSVFTRESTLLVLKSIAPMKCADNGIFSVQNEGFKGFQQGSARIRTDGLAINLYSDEGGVELIFQEKNYKNPEGVTQPEINRVIQTLHKNRLGSSLHF
jgi:hypothetical protein